MDTIRAIAKVPTDMTDRPRIPVHIFNCGEIEDDEGDLDSQSSDSEAEMVNNAFAKYERRRRDLKLKKKQERR
jgi:hypothetical protein